MHELSEEQLKKLYFDYVEYRDSLSYLSTPVSIREFYEEDKNRYAAKKELLAFVQQD